MGEGRRRTALIAIALSLSGGKALADETPSPLTLVAEAGTPFSSVRGRYALADWLALGPRFDLVERTALRVGLEARAIYLESEALRVYGDLYLARAFGVTVESSWDAEINQWVRFAFDDTWSAALRVGLIGYHGREASQSGLLGLAGVRAGYRLDASFDLAADLGWIGDQRNARPLAAFSIEHHF